MSLKPKVPSLKMGDEFKNKELSPIKPMPLFPRNSVYEGEIPSTERRRIFSKNNGDSYSDYLTQITADVVQQLYELENKQDSDRPLPEIPSMISDKEKKFSNTSTTISSQISSNMQGDKEAQNKHAKLNNGSKILLSIQEKRDSNMMDNHDRVFDSDFKEKKTSKWNTKNEENVSQNFEELIPSIRTYHLSDHSPVKNEEENLNNPFLISSDPELARIANLRLSESLKPESVKPRLVLRDNSAPGREARIANRDQESPVSIKSLAKSTILGSGDKSKQETLKPEGLEKFQQLSKRTLFRMSGDKKNMKTSNHSVKDMSAQIAVSDVTHNNQNTKTIVEPIKMQPLINEESLEELATSMMHNFSDELRFSKSYINHPLISNSNFQISDIESKLHELIPTKEKTEPPNNRDILDEPKITILNQDSDVYHSDATQIYTFYGGPLFNPKENPIDSLIFVTEQVIYELFKKFESDITPYIEKVTKSNPILILNSNRENSFYNSRLRNEFSSNNSKPISTSRSARNHIAYKYSNILSASDSSNVKILYNLPYQDESDLSAEFYLIKKKSDDSYHILKIFERNRNRDPENVMFISLLFEIGSRTLSDIINNKIQNSLSFEKTEIIKIFEDCLNNLYHYQRSGLSVCSLHPELIFHSDLHQRYYILPFSPAQSLTYLENKKYLCSCHRNRDSKTSNSHERTSILGHPDYLSPLLRQGFEKGLTETYHNPYKSSVFSLGLILYECASNSSIERLNISKNSINEAISKHQIFLGTSLIGKDFIIQPPNIFEILLNFNEEERPDFINLYFRMSNVSDKYLDPLHPLLLSQITSKETAEQIKQNKSSSVTIFYTQGGKYIGRALDFNGKLIRHGHGSFYDSYDNLIYQGIWHHDFPKDGVYIYNDDYRYEGTWDGFTHDGKGVLYFRDTPCYEGEWKNFKYNGKGKLFYENGNIKYEGDFRLSMRHGNGKSYYSDGNLYHTGYYKEDKFFDRGTLYWPDSKLKFEGEILIKGIDDIYMKGTFYEEYQGGKKGNIYVGELYRDKYHGRGAKYDQKGNMLASGDWNQGELVKSNLTDKNDMFTYSMIRFEMENPNIIPLDCIFIQNTSREGADEFELKICQDNRVENKIVDFMNLQPDQVKKAFLIISKNPYFKGISAIKLKSFPRQEPDFEFKLLLESQNIKKLKEISISECNNYEDSLSKILSETESLVSLNSLIFRNISKISSESCKHLSQTPYLSNLSCLKLKNPDKINDKILIQSLVESNYLSKLNLLSLTNCQISPQTLALLFRFLPKFKQLTKLNLSDNKFGYQGCKLIESTPRHNSLKSITLKNCEINSEGVYYFIKSDIFTSLNTLNLSQNPISDRGFEYIFTHPQNSIEKLILNQCDLELNTLDDLRKITYPSKLKILGLSKNIHIKNDAIEFIATQNLFSNLQELYLEECSITIQGISKLCRSIILQKLRILRLFGKPIAKLLAEDLKRELGIKKNVEIH